MVGEIVAISGLKTVKVKVTGFVRHSIYKKTMKVSSNYLCHNELAEAIVGSVVELIPCRPLSKLKRWVVKRVVLRSE